MNFPRFRDLRSKLSLVRSRPREGSPEQRGKVISFPEQQGAGEPGFFRYGHEGSFLRRVAPGLVTGAADIDPAMVLTATVVGAAFGYDLLWVAVLCIPFLLTVFSVSARIGQETRRGLVDLILRNYGKPLAFTCAGMIVLINLGMIFADLMAVTDALSIILDQRRIFFVSIVAFVVWYTLILSNYQKITRALLFLALPLFIYWAAAILSQPAWGRVLAHAFVPSIDTDPAHATAIVALFGSLMTPYVLVWQTSSRRDQSVSGQDIHASEHRMGTFVSVSLALSIIIAAGTVLHGRIAPGTPLTTRLAASALAPAAGDLGPIIFAVGIIGAGMVALPVLVASLCYSVSEAMGWKYGLSKDPWEAKRFYMLISAALFVAATLNFVRINPVKALYGSQVLAGVLTLPILLFILVLSNDRRVMRTVNSRTQNFWIGGAVGALAGAGLLLLLLKIF